MRLEMGGTGKEKPVVSGPWICFRAFRFQAEVRTQRGTSYVKFEQVTSLTRAQEDHADISFEI